MSDTNVMIFSLIGGIVPALFWLWFWIREDRLRPEPKSAIFSAFIGGILAVLLALFIELILRYLLVDANDNNIKNLPNIFVNFLVRLTENNNWAYLQANFWSHWQEFLNHFNSLSFYKIDIKNFFVVVIMAPIIEETLKLILTYNICLRRKINDEPIDASIYMLTTALGFAAIETALFITSPLHNGTVQDGMISANFRSIGPMLLHLVSSATLGLFIGLAFYKSRIVKFFYMIMGLILAIIIHGLFNLFIMLKENTHNISYFWIACLGTWVMVVIILAFFEKIKTVTRKN
jgi:RsiW-degrading membrane proteinase PrsW (M82 family)